MYKELYFSNNFAITFFLLFYRWLLQVFDKDLIQNALQDSGSASKAKGNTTLKKKDIFVKHCSSFLMSV